MIRINDRIKREMKRKHMNITQLSKRLGVDQSTVHAMLKRDSLQLKKTADLCNAFKFNFFRELAEDFPFEEPKLDTVFKQKEMEYEAKIKELLDEVAQLKEDKIILQTKVNVLDGVIEKLGR